MKSFLAGQKFIQMTITFSQHKVTKQLDGDSLSVMSKVSFKDKYGQMIGGGSWIIGPWFFTILWVFASIIINIHY